jgi:hypothetical protein
MGDDTWWQMAPWAFAAGAHPFPSFNVLDLHTVDDGVMQVRNGTHPMMYDSFLLFLLCLPLLSPQPPPSVPAYEPIPMLIPILPDQPDLVLGSPSNSTTPLHSTPHLSPNRST